MSIIREIPPTAGWPVNLGDIIASYGKSRKFDPGFEAVFSAYLGVVYSKAVNSGTAAFFLILEALKSLSLRRTVIIPSFVCPLVPLAINRAGLKIEVCDIAPDRFDFDYALLEKTCSDNTDVLAITVAHIAGLPLDMERIKAIASRYGIFIIEDCAQSMGAVYQGIQTGSLGDFSFFSLCRGKGMTLYEGGIAVTRRDKFAQALDDAFRNLFNENKFKEALKIFEIFGYWAFYRPMGFWYIFRLPNIYWRLRGRPLKAMIEEFSLDFEVHRISDFRKKLALQQFSRLEENIRRQRTKALFYIDRLSRLSNVKLITELPETISNYPFITCLIEDTLKRDKILPKLEGSGLGFSRIYAKPVCDYDYLRDIVPMRDCPNASSIAKKHITLSTSVFLSDKDLVSVVELLKLCLR